MKIFSFIFALYIVVLNVYPCTDSNLAQIHHDSVFEFIPHKHQQQSENEESCSPFCICKCCQVTACFAFGMIEFQVKEIISNLYAEYYYYTPDKITNAVWRPPTQTV
ncbi:MAG: hypothetical protein D6707_03885 [Bacteroidetes bacterium]|nr:MAG: hypothetical protein D6707_03885 [Bacteroidota bacterium]